MSTLGNISLRDLKTMTAAALRKRGIDVLSEHRQSAMNPTEVQRRLFAARAPKVIFDCGANRGRVIKEYKSVFPDAVIHAFEPTPATFEGLKQEVAGIPGVELVNAAIGEAAGTLDLYFGDIEQSNSLVAKPDPKGTPIKVPVVAIGEYCAQKKIDRVDILKLDVEGFEMPALRGAESLFAARKVDVVLTEISFIEDPGATRFLDLHAFLDRHDFMMFGIYDFQYRPNLRALLADALFVRRDVFKAYEDRAGA